MQWGLESIVKGKGNFRQYLKRKVIDVPPTPTPKLYCSDGSGETRLEESKITHRVTSKKTIAIVKGTGDKGGGTEWKFIGLL